MTSVKSIIFTPEKKKQLNQQRERTQSVASQLNITITESRLTQIDIQHMMELEEELENNSINLQILQQLLWYYQQLVLNYDRKQDVMKDYFTKKIHKVFLNQNVIKFLKTNSGQQEEILKDIKLNYQVSEFQMDSPLKNDNEQQKQITFNQLEEIDQIISKSQNLDIFNEDFKLNAFENQDKKFQDSIYDIKMTPINKNITQDDIKTQKQIIKSQEKKSILKNSRNHYKVSNFHFHNDEELVLNDSRQMTEAYSDCLQNNDHIVENDISRQKQFFRQILLDRIQKNESKNIIQT